MGTVKTYTSETGWNIKQYSDDVHAKLMNDFVNYDKQYFKTEKQLNFNGKTYKYFILAEIEKPGYKYETTIKTNGKTFEVKSTLKTQNFNIKKAVLKSFGISIK